MSLILSIDQSTSATKAIRFGEAGRMLDKTSRDHRQIYPQSGWVEHAPDEIWANVLAATGKLMERNSGCCCDLAALGIGNQREPFWFETGRLPARCTTRLFGRTGAATPSVRRFVSTQRKCQISPMRPYPLIAFALCFFTASGRADPAPKPDFTAAEKQIQTWVDNGAYPGALLWIESEDGATLYEHSWNGVTRETEMTIASASKWLEAATLMSLVDEEKLNLDTPIRRYFPQLTGRQGDNTLRQLFSHTSNLNELNLPKEAEHYGIDRLADYLAKTHTDEVPGDRFWYGGTDLATGARIVEIVQGKPWLLTFGEKIAGPCQMKSTVTGPDLWNFDRTTGGDNFPRSCAQDYMNFLQMLSHDGKYNGRQVLSSQAIHEMEADQVRGAAVKVNEFPESIGCGRYNGVYGLGEWRLALNPRGEAVVLSSPAYTGFFPWIDKRHHLCGVFAAKAGWGAKIDAFHTAPKLFQLIDKGFAASGKPESTLGSK